MAALILAVGQAVYKQFPSLTEAFLNYFDVDLVTSAQQMDQVGHLRYRVYCEEFGYEPASAFPDKRETDQFDAYSVHCIVTHRRSKHAAGCVRMICASDDHALPLETYCLENVFVEYMDSLKGDRDRVCEVSRLAVDPAFRKRPGEDHTQLGEFNAMDCTHQEQRTFSLIAIAAILAGFAISSLSNRTEIFTMMEPNLPRLLRRAGIPVAQAGEVTEYHGQRSPYFISTELSLANMRDDLLGLYGAIHERLACDYNAHEAVAHGQIG